MYFEELLIIVVVVVGIYLYRVYQGQNISKFFSEGVAGMIDKITPYSYRSVREKTKELGQDYTPRQYIIQLAAIGGFTAVITYLYFYNLTITVVYVIISSFIVPYLSYLRSKRIYSEYIFEQIQVYTSNVIMEFATTQSFVKSLEGVLSSGLLEDPVKTDVQHMVDLAYDNGTIDESLNYMSKLYPYYIVKNMHQLFLQITKEGARNSADALDNMQMDIDMLIESVYRDRIERATFHKNFLQFGIMLYLLVMLVQYLVGRETYFQILSLWYVSILLHLVLIVNTGFLLKGEKYYNENVGAE
jgi:hypothetical protein